MSDAGDVPRIGLVHTGSFSGITAAVAGELRGLGLAIDTHDLTRLSRRPKGVLAHAQALAEARRHRCSWSRTSVWADFIGSELNGLPAGSLLFMQTLLACDLEPGRKYVVFTDRISSERDGTRWEPPCSPDWLEAEGRFLRNAQHVFVMGPSTESQLIRDGVAPYRISVVGSGTNARLPPPRNRRQDDPNELLFVGLDWERKGGPIAVAAMQQVNRRRTSPLHLTIVGAEPTIDDQNVSVLGPVDFAALQPAFEAAHLFVMPTLSEAFGVAYYEALATGIPVVGSAIGNVPWIVGDGGACPDPEPASVAAALEHMLKEYASFADAAYTRGRLMSETWTWRHIAERVAVEGLGLEAVWAERVAVGQPRAAAIVVTYNRFEALEETMLTVLAQSKQPDWIIIVDNASPDGTAGRAMARWPDAVVVPMQSNGGPGAGIAAGMREAMALGAQVCWLVEDDSLYEPNYLQLGLSFLATHESVSMVGSHGWEQRRGLWHGLEPTTPVTIGALPTLDGAMVTRDAIQRAGVPVEDFFLMIQDIEYPLRLQRKGLTTAVYDSLKVAPLRLGAGSANGSAGRAYYQTRNHLLLVRRQGLKLFPGFVWRTVALVLSDLKAKDRKSRLSARAHGFWDGLRNRTGQSGAAARA